MNVLAVSFAFPPLFYPRSIQVARLLKHVKAKTVLICADESGANKDATLEPDAEKKLAKCLRVPFEPPRHQQLISRFAYRYCRPLWNYYNIAPDQYRSWKPRVTRKVAEFLQASSFSPDVVVTFGQPFSDHVIGLELQAAYGLPWVAHFSDPWVDNIFNRYDTWSKRKNLALEKQVIERADTLIFTSDETIDLVFAKYGGRYKEKARVLPHCFDPTTSQRHQSAKDSPITIRYMGKFYGQRTPAALVNTLLSLLETTPDLLRGVRFEIVGDCPAELLAASGGSRLPSELLTVRSHVKYGDNLELMGEADGLLVIDAPDDISVFLPSKLIDYLGAGRPVIGFTPPGPSETLIRELGGQTAHPSDLPAMRVALIESLTVLRARRLTNDPGMWGTPEIRSRYEARRVADSFLELLRQTLNGSIKKKS